MKRMVSSLCAVVMILSFIAVPIHIGAAKAVSIQATSWETNGIVVPEIEGADDAVLTYQWYMCDRKDAPMQGWEAITDAAGNVCGGVVNAQAVKDAALLMSWKQAGKYIMFFAEDEQENKFQVVSQQPVAFTPNLINNGQFSPVGADEEGNLFGWSDIIYHDGYSNENGEPGCGHVSKKEESTWYARLNFPAQLEPGTYRFHGFAMKGVNASKNFRVNLAGYDSGNGSGGLGNESRKWYAIDRTITLKEDIYEKESFLSMRMCTGVAAGADPFYVDDLALTRVAPYVFMPVIEGTAQIGQPLEAAYEYVSEYDTENMTEGNTNVVWQVSETGWGEWETAAEGTTFTPDAGCEEKYIRAVVTPINSAGFQGPALASSPVFCKAEADTWQLDMEKPSVIYQNNRTINAVDITAVCTINEPGTQGNKMKSGQMQTQTIGPGENMQFTFTPPGNGQNVSLYLYKGREFLSMELIDFVKQGDGGVQEMPESVYSGGVSIDYDAGAVDFYTQIDNYTGDMARVTVLKPGFFIEDITPDNFTQAAEHFADGIKIQDGRVRYQFLLNHTSIEKENFFAYIKGKNDPISFCFYNGETVRRVLKVIQNASVADVERMFDPENPILVEGIRINDIFKIDLTDFFALEQKYRWSSLEIFKKEAGSFSKVSEIAAVFEKAVQEQKVQREIDLILADICNTDPEGMKEKLIAHNDILCLDLEAPYGYAMKLGEKEGQQFYQSIHSELKNQSEINGFRKTFARAVAAYAARAGKWDNLENILKANNTVFQLDFDGKYKTVTNKNEFYKKLVLSWNLENKTMEDIIVQVRQKFDSVLSNWAETTPKPRPGGGGGGGSSSGGTTITLPQEPLKTVTPIVEQEEEETPPKEPALFTDIETCPWAKTAINALAQEGMIFGDGQGHFEPERAVTRAEFVKMIMECFELSYTDADAAFADVEQGAWYYPYVAQAVACGIVSGTGEGNFEPDKTVTRQDMAVFIHRAMIYADKKLEKIKEPAIFDDVYEIDKYAMKSVNIMQETGIMNGVGNGIFAPKEYATRAMAAKVIYGAISK